MLLLKPIAVPASRVCPGETAALELEHEAARARLRVELVRAEDRAREAVGLDGEPVPAAPVDREHERARAVARPVGVAVDGPEEDERVIHRRDVARLAPLARRRRGREIEARAGDCATAVHDAPAFQDEDAIGVHDRREPVGDQNGDDVLVPCDLADRLADLLLGERVERRGRLVEHQQVRAPQQGARD